MGKRSVRVVAGLFRHQDRVLVQQRPHGKARGLLWEFPGGKVESGEHDKQALLRECLEELGVKVTVGKVRWEGEHEYDDLIVRLVLYDGLMPADTTLRPEGGATLAWVQIHELGRLPFCEADQPIVDRLVCDML